MAKYKASPRYVIGTITFDMHGEYETDKAEEIEVLDALVPMWVRRLDEVKPEEPQAPEPKQKPEPKPRKSSAK